MHFLPERGTLYELLDKYSPTELVVFDMAAEATYHGRSYGGLGTTAPVDGYCKIDIDLIARTAWTTKENVVDILEHKFSDSFELIEIIRKSGDIFYIREVDG